MQEEKLQKLFHLCKVLLDEDRLRILGVLANRAANVKELAVQLDLKEVIASRHLARLVEAGLVRADPDDESVYRLDLEVVQSMKKDLFARDQTNEPIGGHESVADKVLNSFLDGERLIRIPSNHTKRMVILEWLASQFEVGSTYPERAVNEILKRHHPDYAALRRALVDYGLMQREKGIYWRVVEGKS